VRRHECELGVVFGVIGQIGPRAGVVPADELLVCGADLGCGGVVRVEEDDGGDVEVFCACLDCQASG